MPHLAEQQRIKSNNCCGRCFYNIPAGTMVMLLPGMCLLIMGVIMVAIEESQGDDSTVTSSWRDGLISTGLVMVILGAVLTLMAIVACVWSVARYRMTKHEHEASKPSGGYRPTHHVGHHRHHQPVVATVGEGSSSDLYGYPSSAVALSDAGYVSGSSSSGLYGHHHHHHRQDHPQQQPNGGLTSYRVPNDAGVQLVGVYRLRADITQPPYPPHSTQQHDPRNSRR